MSSPPHTIAILAFGSLNDDPGAELQPLIRECRKTTTPFEIEFARFSEKRYRAPTLVPVTSGGAQCEAQLLILDPQVSLPDAKNMLYRREIGEVENLEKKYVRKKDPGPNTVLIEALTNHEGIATVLHVDFPEAGKEQSASAELLAKRAIESAKHPKNVEAGRDGITYLINAKQNGIITPLTAAYEQAVLRQTKSETLEEARAVLQP